MDWSNWVGIAIQAVAIVLPLGAFIVRLHLDLRLWIAQSQATAAKVEKVEQKIEKISDLVTQIAIQDARLNSIETRLQELYMLNKSHVG